MSWLAACHLSASSHANQPLGIQIPMPKEVEALICMGGWQYNKEYQCRCQQPSLGCHPQVLILQQCCVEHKLSLPKIGLCTSYAKVRSGSIGMPVSCLIRCPCFVTIGSAGLSSLKAIANDVLHYGKWLEFNMGGHIDSWLLAGCWK